MPIVQNDNPQLTPKERETMDYERDMWQKQADYNLQIAKIETRWNALLRIPSMLILLPVKILFGLAYIAHAIVKKEPPPAFWEFLKH